MNGILARTALTILGFALLALAAGLLFGAAWGWTLFSLSLVGVIVHHVRHLGVLREWARRSLGVNQRSNRL